MTNKEIDLEKESQYEIYVTNSLIFSLKYTHFILDCTDIKDSFKDTPQSNIIDKYS